MDTCVSSLQLHWFWLRPYLSIHKAHTVPEPPCEAAGTGSKGMSHQEIAQEPCPEKKQADQWGKERTLHKLLGQWGQAWEDRMLLTPSIVSARPLPTPEVKERETVRAAG